MKEKLRRGLQLAALILTVFNATLYFAMRPCWSGITKTFGYAENGSRFLLDLPIYLCVILTALALSCMVFAIRNRGKHWPVIYLVTGVALLGALSAIIVLGAKDYLRFIWPNFLEGLAAALAVGAAWWFLWAYPKTKLAKSRWFRACLLGIVIVCGGLLLTGFRMHAIAVEPVVYAVEEEYQIVFSSDSTSFGWVTVDGVDYYDLYNGSMTKDRIHKVHIPMSVLDRAKGYEIHLQQVIYAGPFGGILGSTISKSYGFRPVDSSDGLTYLAFSDIHMNKSGAVATASKAGDYDFLVMNGDIVSMVDRFSDANYCNEVSFAITGGEIPVVYARGNHELKGDYAQELHKYVGSKNDSFFYNFYFDGVYGTVLDLGEDHENDWWEYYGTAHYDDYRQAQVDFLKAELEKKTYEKYDYRLAVCHIPVVFVSKGVHSEVKETLTELLNTMGIDMLLCGHEHEAMVFEPGAVKAGETLNYNPAYDEGICKGTLMDFRFPGMMVSKHGYTQTDADESSHIGLLVAVAPGSGEQVCRYLNSRGETVPVVNPFAPIDYGEEVRFPLRSSE